MVTGRLKQKMASSLWMALTYTEVFGGYLLWLENTKEDISTKPLTGNRKTQEGYTEW